SLAITCTAASNWAQLISRTRFRGLLRSWPSRPRGSSLWGERCTSEGSFRRLEDRGGMNPGSLARRRGADQRPKPVPRSDLAAGPDGLDVPWRGNSPARWVDSAGSSRSGNRDRGAGVSGLGPPHQVLLGDARDQAPAPVEDPAERQAATALGSGALH